MIVDNEQFIDNFRNLQEAYSKHVSGAENDDALKNNIKQFNLLNQQVVKDIRTDNEMNSWIALMKTINDAGIHIPEHDYISDLKTIISNNNVCVDARILGCKEYLRILISFIYTVNSYNDIMKNSFNIVKSQFSNFKIAIHCLIFILGYQCMLIDELIKETLDAILDIIKNEKHEQNLKNYNQLNAEHLSSIEYYQYYEKISTEIFNRLKALQPNQVAHELPLDFQPHIEFQADIPDDNIEFNPEDFYYPDYNPDYNPDDL